MKVRFLLGAPSRKDIEMKKFLIWVFLSLVLIVPSTYADGTTPAAQACVQQCADNCGGIYFIERVYLYPCGGGNLCCYCRCTTPGFSEDVEEVVEEEKNSCDVEDGEKLVVEEDNNVEING